MVTPETKRTAQTLLIDADDTLWENNVHFERAIADFISYLDHREHTPEEVRLRLNACERVTIAEHGYGVTSFQRSLVRCFEELTAAPVTPEQHARIVGFANVITEAEVELLPHVASTLGHLAQRHRLLLVTKGNRLEQEDKLRRSGLQSLFSAVEVPAEKNQAMYRDLVARHQLQPETTWMIGNSPRSDINPSVAAGLHAVFIPHSTTWVLEEEPLSAVPAGQTVLQLHAFQELELHF